MTIWHPHTETPAEDLTTAIIAVPPSLRDDPDQGAMLCGVIHVWKDGQWYSESGELPLDAPVFWWCAEDYLLEDLPAEAHERAPAAGSQHPVMDAYEQCDREAAAASGGF